LIREILEEFDESGNQAYGAEPQFYISVRLTVRGSSELLLEKIEFFDVLQKQVLCNRRAGGTERVKAVLGSDFATWKFYLDEIDNHAKGDFSADPSSFRIRVRFVKANGRKIRKLRLLPRRGLANLVGLFIQEKNALRGTEVR
jgi:hypothetical protein